jgi:hypothetical protein|tara:strand:- start:116 stop:586 length:471 start_codon:yes stop_codon:yes gene_type:complete
MAEPTTPPQPPAPPVAAKRPRAGGTSQMGVIVLVVVIVIASYMWLSQSSLSSYKEDWQAVFLTNGQVYFGNIVGQNTAEVIVKDIYYLQVTRPLQQTGEGEQQANPQGELSLVKLGNELHGPTDSMFINRDHVLFVEDLKDGSNVVTAIQNYKEGQ